jgi:hypothetical protein
MRCSNIRIFHILVRQCISYDSHNKCGLLTCSPLTDCSVIDMDCVLQSVQLSFCVEIRKQSSKVCAIAQMVDHSSAVLHFEGRLDRIVFSHVSFLKLLYVHQLNRMSSKENSFLMSVTNTLFHSLTFILNYITIH